MEKLSIEKLPNFLNDNKFKWFAVVIGLLQTVTIILGFFVHFTIGIVLLVAFIITVLSLYYLAKKLV